MEAGWSGEENLWEDLEGRGRRGELEDWLKLGCTGGSAEASLLGTQHVCVCRDGRPGPEGRRRASCDRERGVLKDSQGETDSGMSEEKGEAWRPWGVGLGAAFRVSMALLHLPRASGEQGWCLPHSPG